MIRAFPGLLGPRSLPADSSTTQRRGCMSRQDANAALALTSFLYGGNADYIDELYARYEADPQAVDAQWQSFFASLKDNERDVVRNGHGPSWQRSDWPPVPRGD